MRIDSQQRAAVPTLAWFLALLAACAAPARDDDSEHAHDPVDGARHAPAGELLGADLARGWLDPWEHRHASERGTPLVHAFLSEPAFVGREVLLHGEGSGSDRALEAEVEYALTRRIALVVAAGWADGSEGSGITDSAIAVRALGGEWSRVLLSLSVETTVPTGSRSEGTGGDAWGWGVRGHAWCDLGAWFTLQSTFAYENVPAVGERVWEATVSLAKSFPVRPLFGRQADHGAPLASLFAESAVAWDEDEWGGEWMVGASYALASRVDLRAAFLRSFEGDDGWIVGLIWHF